MEMSYDDFLVGGMKMYANGLGHMTETFVIPIGSKILSNSTEPEGQYPWGIVVVIWMRDLPS